VGVSENKPAIGNLPFNDERGDDPERRLRLVPIYCGSNARLLEPLAERIGHAFGLAVDSHPLHFDPEVAFDATRGQYNSRILLEYLDDPSCGEGKVLGVAGVDLFIPVLTYVFGEAQLGNRAAVVSTYRLDNKLYGLRPDPRLLLERLCREAIHEVGHTFNLLHCHHDECVMRSSTYVECIDLKSDRLCAGCRHATRQSRSAARLENGCPQS
jgi:archaemetzincin